MAAVKVLPYHTIKDWERWDGAWELIEGIPYAMSPAPLPKHQRISLQLSMAFEQALENCSGCNVYQAIDWIINDDTILQPDVLIVCGEIKHRLDFAPVLVVEILSKATALKDRNNKFHIYEKQGVMYYLIVNPENETVEIYEFDGGSYQLKSFENTGQFSLSNSCTITIHFNRIWY